MADKKPYLTVNYEAMTFTVNDAEKPTAQDEADIARFLRAGFKMRHKSAKRTQNATDKALTDETILAELKKAENELALVNYLFIKSDKSKDAEGKRIGGFFKAKAWYQNEYKAGKWNPSEEETAKLKRDQKKLLDALKQKEEAEAKAKAEAEAKAKK